MKHRFITTALILALAVSSAAQTVPWKSKSRLTVTVTGNLGAVTPGTISAAVDGIQAQVSETTFVGTTPTKFVVLVDTSGSNRDKAEYELTNGFELFRKLLENGNTGFLGEFDTELYLDQKTSTIANAKKEISRMRFGGGTAIYDSVLSAAKFLNKRARADEPRSLFVISDGEDDNSTNKVEYVVQELQRLNVTVHTITLMESRSSKKLVEKFVKLSAETGGTTTVLARPKEFVPALLQALHQQYWITILSSVLPDGKLHSLRLTSTDASLAIHGPTRAILH